MELTTKTTRLLGRIAPFNLAYTRKYNEEGRLVAINVKSDNFELEQRVGRLR
jgi:YD repeat-containing protein